MYVYLVVLFIQDSTYTPDVNFLLRICVLMKPNVTRMRQGRPICIVLSHMHRCAHIFGVSSIAIEPETESKSTATLCVLGTCMEELIKPSFQAKIGTSDSLLDNNGTLRIKL